MDKRLIGYARISSITQNEDRQMIALQEYGVSPKRIYLDRASGKDFDRRNYKRMLKRLKKGNILVVKSIDIVDFTEVKSIRKADEHSFTNVHTGQKL